MRGGRLRQREARKASPGCSISTVDRRVRLRAGVGLHVWQISHRTVFSVARWRASRDVNILAAAVVAATRVTLSVFVGELRALRLHHGFRRAGRVLAGDQLDVIFLALVFGVDNGKTSASTAASGEVKNSGRAFMGMSFQNDDWCTVG